ncbi:MAG: sigma-54 interaction domain-containing protein, partial [Halanaerobiales bacterium]
TPIIQKGEVIRVIVNARDLGELDMAVNDSRERDKLRIYLDQEQDYVDSESTGHIISKSQQMKEILQTSARIANTDSTVLITGASGVGKEVVARFIHEQSEERENFVKINCAAIPERLLESELFGYETGAFSGARREGKSGLIEKADDGTLFLDEIAEMPLNMQAKLLQVIQEHRVTRIGGVDPIEVNFRLITATNQNLKKMVNKGEFREDLYYRLKVVPIDVPPLRQRREDIYPLVNYFSNQFGEKYGKRIEFTDEARNLLLNYDWPGNVRELINLLERVIVTTDNEIIESDFLHRFMEMEEENEESEILVNDILPLKEAVNRVEKKLLLLAREKGESTYDIARMLGVNQSTVVRKLKKYFD